MKKRIVFLLMLVASMFFLSSVYASNLDFDLTNLTTSVDDQGYYSNATIENITSETKTGVFVVASYSPDGKFLSRSYADISIPANSSESYSLQFDSIEPGFLKAFVLDSWENPVPLALTETLYVAEPPKYAIVLKRSADDETVKLLLPDGTTKTYEIDVKFQADFLTNFATGTNDVNLSTLSVDNRVVTYNISSKTGKITNMFRITPDSTLASVEYKARTSMLGSGNKILDTTPIIVVKDPYLSPADYTNYASFSKDDLVDEAMYSGYVYKINTTVSFVVITNIGLSFNEYSRFAVATDSAKCVLTEDGDMVHSVTVLYEGELQELLFAVVSGMSAADSLTAGDVFYFTTDWDGYVDAVYTAPFAGNTAWDAMVNVIDWSYELWNPSHTPIQFVSGVVTEVTPDTIAFAETSIVQNGYLDITYDLEETWNLPDANAKQGVVYYGIADDCVAYTYDINMKTRYEKDKYDATSPSSINASNFSIFDYGNGVLNDGIYQVSDEDIACGTTMLDKATVAAAMIVDGEIVAIFAVDRTSSSTEPAIPIYKQETVELDASTYVLQADIVDIDQYNTSSLQIEFGSTFYKLDDQVDIYVNDTYYQTIVASEDIIGDVLTLSQSTLDHILGNAYGTVKLVDKNNIGAYTEIHVDFYQIGEVASVYKDSDETVISFSSITCALDESSSNLDEITISNQAIQEGHTSVTVTRNGVSCDLSSIQAGDIVAYATDFTVTSIVDPEKISIIATNNTASGVVTAIYDNDTILADDDSYTIGGVTYDRVPGTVLIPSIYLKCSLDLTLDPFGRIYAAKLNADNIKYAIVLKRSADNETVKLLLPDGTINTYEIDPKFAYSFIMDFATGTNDVNLSTLSVDNRVVTYNISSKTGKITNMVNIAPDSTLASVEYKARTSMLGSGNKILDTTPIIVVKDPYLSPADESNYVSLSKDFLADGRYYDGYVYKFNTTVTFVVITAFGPEIDENSRFAVAIDTAKYVLTEDGDKAMSVKVLYNGEVQELLFAVVGGMSAADSLTAGDVFYFTTDWDGYVDAVYTAPFAGNTAWDAMVKVIDWSYTLWNPSHSPIQFVSGVVTEVAPDAIAFAETSIVQNGYLDITYDLEETWNLPDANAKQGVVYYGIADDCVAYTYDANMQTKDETQKYNVTSPASINASNFSMFDYGNGILDDGIYAETAEHVSNGTTMMSIATEATAMVVDGEIVAIFAIEK